MKPEANLPPPWDTWPKCEECGGVNGQHAATCSTHELAR